MSDRSDFGQVYLEFITIGNQVKVVALDAATGVEVSIFGPKNTSKQELQRIVVQKLRRRILQLSQQSSQS